MIQKVREAVSAARPLTLATILSVLPLLGATAGVTVYAESTYVKKSAIRDLRIDLAQDRLNVLNLKRAILKSQGRSTPADLEAELEYWQSKLANLRGTNGGK